MNSHQPLAGLSSDPEARVVPSKRFFHNDHSHSLAMSASGPSEDSRISPIIQTSAAGSDEAGQDRSNASGNMSLIEPSISSILPPHTNLDRATQTTAGETSPLELRAHFDDFAAQLRLHRHNEHKRRMLQHRRQHLQKAVALSGRLHRLSSWVHDGLVEISRNDDKSNTSSFVRVQQHLQDLSDVCISQWNHDIQALDPVNSTATREVGNSTESFLGKLSSDAQRDCLDFLHMVRSNPRYLIDRFKAVSPAQLSALSTSPRYQNLPASILASLSQNSGRSSQRRHRILSYSKSLELYATSFERRNAITFLLYNCFGSDQAENTLRMSTWASICAGLFQESRPAFGAIIFQVLSGFVPLGQWSARDRFHLFLMDVLQRGAFLVEPFDPNRSTSSFQSSFSDHVETDQTREFFESAVTDLFQILLFDGGIPTKALELAQAIEGKLEDPYLQSEFRTFFFFDWFLRYFLRITMNFPENEKMLLQFHVSPTARKRILVQLHQRADIAANQVYMPDFEQTVNNRVIYCVKNLIGLISGQEIQDPYKKNSEQSDLAILNEFLSFSSLAICADDVIHVLDALSQQYNDPILSSSLSAFASQYPTANNGFRRLRNELLILQEPGSSSTSVHPCQEDWLILPVLQDGRPGRPEQSILNGQIDSQISNQITSRLGASDAARMAAVRLAFENQAADRTTQTPFLQQHSGPSLLVNLFHEKARAALNAADNVDALYWNSASEILASHYRASAWGHDDSRLLQPLSQILSSIEVDSIMPIQSQIATLEDEYAVCKSSLAGALKRLHQLKVRLWYETAVITSSPYEETKNIARALNYMALPTSNLPDNLSSVSSEKLRPGTSTSTASSMFEQTRVDTINILKAPQEHGGAKKLADEQVEMTKKWLVRSNVENFCKGEERIHRFCMEIKMATKKLAAETFAESPVLWSSDLWAREKHAYEVGATATFSVHGSTRPPSVMSETLSSTQYPSRPLLGSLGLSSRSLEIDTASSHGRKPSFYSLGSHRLNRDTLGSDFAASLSPGQSFTATSGESVSSFWSPHPSQRSVTSASHSLPSRAPSISNDFAVLRVGESSIEKAKFLDELQHDLTTLLLSDLGNPVWGQGSETDNWIGSARENPNLTQRLQRQQQISRLLPPTPSDKASKSSSKRPNGNRRTWSADTLKKGNDGKSAKSPSRTPAVLPADLMMVELQDVLDRISHYVDPRMKLDAVYEFKVLAMQTYPKRAESPFRSSEAADSKRGPRRRGSSMGAYSRHESVESSTERQEPETQSEITEYLKTLLLTLRHRTLFRDLQYIAAFIPADTLNKTERGRAFLHVGLGALACKDEYCRTMVDLADKIIAKDGIKRRASEGEPREEGLVKAKDYWILAAREGNRIAQRELASLYLAHPEVLPIVSLPMSLSSEIFKSEMMWQDQSGENGNIQSLCLALHWMQQAADKGDPVAQQKMEERRGSSSLR